MVSLFKYSAMKKIIALVLILVITPFFIHSDKSLSQQVEEIRVENSKDPETANWEYIKDRAFDNVGNLKKGYDKPVLLRFDKLTPQDSVIVDDFIKKIKELAPAVEIYNSSDTIPDAPYHQIVLGLGNPTFPPGVRFYYNIKNLDDGTTIYRSKPGIVKTSDSSKHSLIYFNFTDSISDLNRKMYVVSDLTDAIFSSSATNKSYNYSFYVGRFNQSRDFSYGLLGGYDKFYLQKVYAADFEKQFEDYLYANYPWRYAYSFSHKKRMDLFAIGVVSLLGLVVFLLLFSLFQNKKFKYSFLNYFIPVLLIWAYIVNFHWIYEYFTDFDTVISWGKSVLFMITVIPLFALFSSFIMWVFDKIFINMNFNFQLVQKVLFTFIAFMAPLVLIFFYDGHRQEGIDFFLPALFLWIALAIGRGILIYLNHMSQSLVNEKDVELSRLKEAHAQSELKLLQSHINPHFLYNALNSIAGLAKDDSDKTERMALSLSDLFRYSLNKKGEKMSTVSEEVTLVENYLEIEKIRFGERLEFTLTVDDAVKEEKIPMFMLQPLLENAIKHGVSKIGGPAKVSLDIKKDKEGLLIVVSDNGPDFPKGLVSGHGLQTVYDLLRLSYGKKASLRWENSPKKQILIDIKKNNAHD